MIQASLPKGQRTLREFPRFGLWAMAARKPSTLEIAIRVSGDVAETITIGAALQQLPRVSQLSDFHCVTTWTYPGALWGGVRFADVYREIIEPLARPQSNVRFVVFKCQDGYRSSMLLEDLLDETVLLADSLDGVPLTIEHGAPLRLVAPNHYGYKSTKHVDRIELHVGAAGYHSIMPRFMEHPRARVAHEERGRFVPGWLLRHLYRPLIRPTIRRFREGLPSSEQRP